MGEVEDPELLLTAAGARGRRQTDGAAGEGGGGGVRRGTGILEGQMAARRTGVVGT